MKHAHMTAVFETIANTANQAVLAPNCHTDRFDQLRRLVELLAGFVAWAATARPLTDYELRRRLSNLERASGKNPVGAGPRPFPICERCGITVDGFEWSRNRIRPSLFDYCYLCSKNLCPGCASIGCCGRRPIASGNAVDFSEV